MPTQPNRREEKTYRTRLFAAARGFQFPQELRVSLAQALTESDPLNFRRYGEVDPSVYAGFSPSFWDTQYKEFQKDPTSCVVRALESAFGPEVSRDAVATACEFVLKSTSQATN